MSENVSFLIGLSSGMLIASFISKQSLNFMLGVVLFLIATISKVLTERKSSNVEHSYNRPMRTNHKGDSANIEKPKHLQ